MSEKHPISLDTVLFTKCMVTAVPGYEPPEGDTAAVPRPENNIQVRKDVERGAGWYEATMRTVINPLMEKTAPYSVEMICTALLHADDTLTEEDANRGVFITAHSVLYGAIRETVAWLTGRQPYGGLVLGLSVLRPAVKAEKAAVEKQ
jgi:hypothetical protein